MKEYTTGKKFSSEMHVFETKTQCVRVKQEITLSFIFLSYSLGRHKESFTWSEYALTIGKISKKNLRSLVQATKKAVVEKYRS